LKTLELTGYIDDEVFWGDEITPDMLRDALSGYDGDLTIKLHSYGGSCAAATRMYDIIREYAGNVIIVISGVAASAGSVLAMAGDRVEMTPGSLLMVHNPSCVAWGEERDLEEAIRLLQSVKESILNIYSRGTDLGRDELSGMMDATTWLDAGEALEQGFIDGITGDAELSDDDATEEVDTIQSPSPSALKAVAYIDRHEAEAKVRAWVERQKPHASGRPDPEPTPAPQHDSQPDTQSNTTAPTQPAGISVAQLEKRLSLLRH